MTKRAIDVIGAFCLLVLLAPLLLAIAAAVHLGDGGPVLYRQQRIGVGGRPFVMLKFRSMTVSAEADGIARFAAVGDARITPVGGILRRHRLDELPQLINVLRGEMSLVGPRPERPEIIERFRDAVPLFDLRHAAPPGLTGWAQVRYPYGDCLDDIRAVTEYDIHYITHADFLMDAWILLRTVRTVLLCEGAR